MSETFPDLALDYAPWSEAHTTWIGLDSYLESLQDGLRDGVHSISSGVAPLDILIINSHAMGAGQAVLPVFFGAAVKDRSKGRPPFFSGSGIAGKLGVSVLCVADPSLALSEDLALAWYAGSEFNACQESIAELLAGISQRLGVELLLIGGSGGGFAALQFGDRVRAPCSVLVWNPQTDFTLYYRSAVLKYLRVAYPSEIWPDEISQASVEAILKKIGVVHSIIQDHAAGRSPRRLIYLQNEDDVFHVTKHAQPWRRALKLCESDVGLWCSRGEDIAMVQMSWGAGHSAPPQPMLISLIMRLSDLRETAKSAVTSLLANSKPATLTDATSIKVFILGSCVSRDVFDDDRDGLRVVNYVARSSLACALRERAPRVVPDLSLVQSKWQQRMIAADLCRRLPGYLAGSDFDFLLLDLVDERFKIGFIDDEPVTLSPEFRRARVDVPVSGVMGPGHPKRCQLWEEGVGRLFELVDVDRIVLNRVFLATRTLDGEPLDNQDSIIEQNLRLEEMYRYLDEKFGVRSIDYPDSLFVADPNHRWGLGPFHYGEMMYEHTRISLEAMLGAVPTDSPKLTMYPQQDNRADESILAVSEVEGKASGVQSESAVALSLSGANRVKKVLALPVLIFVMGVLFPVIAAWVLAFGVSTSAVLLLIAATSCLIALIPLANVVRSWMSELGSRLRQVRSSVMDIESVCQRMESDLRASRQAISDLINRQTILERSLAGLDGEIKRAARSGETALQKSELSHTLLLELRTGSAKTHSEITDLIRRVKISHNVIAGLKSDLSEADLKREDVLRRTKIAYRASTESAAEQLEATSMLRRQLDAKISSVRRDIERLPGDCYAFRLAAEKLVGADSRMPPLGDWAITSPTLTAMLGEVARRPSIGSIMECGSGTSTVWLGLACKARGEGHVFALEHLREFADRTRAAVADNGVSDWVTVIDAPLVEVEVEGTTYSWYDVSALSEVEPIDILFVDGPPASTGPRARYPAFPVLGRRLAEGAWVVLDDTVRQDEKEIAESWVSSSPRLSFHSSLVLPKSVVMEFSAVR